MTPNESHGSPSRNANAGAIVWYGRFPGAYTFACVGSIEKSAPRDCSAKPSVGSTSPLPTPVYRL